MERKNIRSMTILMYGHKRDMFMSNQSFKSLCAVHTIDIEVFQTFGIETGLS